MQSWRLMATPANRDSMELPVPASLPQAGGREGATAKHALLNSVQHIKYRGNAKLGDHAVETGGATPPRSF
jgi:hypothetical protein